MIETLANFPAITTERTYIMLLKPEDAKALEAIADPSVLILENARGMIEANTSGQYCFLGIWRKDGGDLIGSVNFHLCNDTELEMGYWFAKSAQGQGYALESIRRILQIVEITYPARHVIVETGSENHRSLRLLERLGFIATEKPGRSEKSIVFELNVIPCV